MGHFQHNKTVEWVDGNIYMVNGVQRSNRFYMGSEIKTASKVSQYGATSPIEFVAETYAGMVSGKTYPDDVMDLYRKWGGPEV
jgi:hypothetical protein